jgi:tetratricopeptide (TPR) repeat protein
MDEMAAKEYLTQGNVLAGQGLYEEAIAFLDKAERENPMEIEVYLTKGIIYANLEKYDDAGEQFEKALKVDRSSGVAYFHLGSVAIMNGDTALGFERYNKAITNGYDDAQIYFSIGLLHEDAGEFDMALRQYSKAISKDPMRADIRIRKAQLYQLLDRIPEALQTLDETILTNPDIFEGYHHKFSILLGLKQYDKAQELLDQAAELFPKDQGFALDRSTLLIEQNKIEEALEWLKTLEAKEDTESWVLRRIYMDRAQIYSENEDINSAIVELEKAKALSEKINEFDEEIQFLLCSCFLAAEDFEKLLVYSRVMLEKAEDGYQKESVRYYEPLALKMLDRMDEALPLYNEAISEYRNQSLARPGDMDSYMFRVMCLRDIEQYEKALELVDYVVTLQPELGEVRMLRAAVLESMGRTEESEKEAKEAVSMLPENLRQVIKDVK